MRLIDADALMEQGVEDELHYKATQALTDVEVRKMEHAIGWNEKKIYHRSGNAYFKPYRNYYDAAECDREVWSGLVEKGFAEGTDAYYWLTFQGLNVLSALKEVFIYSDNANGNEIDASTDVIEILLNDAVYCGYGCWLPTNAKSIALRARLPYKLTLSTLHYLQDKWGYVKKTYYGGVDDDGYPMCVHGWVLAKKWIDENKPRYDKAQKEEYARMDAIDKGISRKEWYE